MKKSRSVVVLAVVAAAATALAIPVAADPLAAPLGPPPIEAAPSPSSAGERPSVHAPAAEPDEGLVTSSSTVPVGPGLELTEFDRFDPNGWIRGDTLTVDMAAGPVPTYLNPGVVADRTPLSEQVERSGAVAGVNGDFFDMNATGAPDGVGIADGELQNAPAEGHNLTASVTAEGQARLAEVFLDATVTLPGDVRAPASNLNGPVLPADGIGVYTPLWGQASRSTAVLGAQRVTEVEIRDGVVAEVRPQPVDGPIPAGSTVLLARDAGADVLAGLKPGDAVGVSYAPRSDAGEIAVAVGGSKTLVRDGVIQEPLDDGTKHPRTAAGFSADGSRMWLVTVDGTGISRGMTELDIARHMKSLGADDAVNFDGGGSTTMLARPVGDAGPSVRNLPADGPQRPVPNGFGFATPPGSGELTGFAPHTASPGDDAERVLSGLSRRLVPGGHDESGAPVTTDTTWSSANPGRGEVAGDVFTGKADPGDPGRRAEVEVSASNGGISGSTTMTVLGEPVRLGTSTEQLGLAKSGDTGTFSVYGYDADGYGTWLAPRDVTLDYDPKVVEVTEAGDQFRVTALTASGASNIKVTAGGLTSHLAASVGSSPETLSGLDGPAGWTASVFPEGVGAAIDEAPGHEGGQGLGLDYRLDGTTATRAAYVNADQPVELPPGTQRFGMWINGDGKGAWVRAELRDAAEVATVVDLSLEVDWTGWRYVDTALPDGLPAGQKLSKFYAVENAPDQAYSGRLEFDDLTASVSPDARPPADPRVPDPALVTDGVTAPEGLRVAVVSDAQFTADDPESPLVAQARRSMREAVAAKPDLVLINGDLTDRGTAPDFALARTIIAEELEGKVPWRYVPGNHEAEGGDGLAEFQAEFGAPSGVEDIEGIRLVRLDSSRGSLRAGGFDQVRMLREALDGAAADPAVRGVLVAMHHPVDDPAPAGNSELEDAKEADLVTDWLSGFERESGKSAGAVTSHAGVFSLSRVDGVPYLVNGNSGKAPAAAPGDGGFTGWSLVRVDPDDAAQPVRIETRAHVDELTLTAPGPLAVGDTAAATATVAQGDREIPVAYPVGADWAGDPALHFPADGPPGPEHVVSFDPATGTITALKAGTAELRVTVNGVTRAATLTVN
ncbi:hypothetical protein CFN78_03605 [Amycolatopsis antarctica]|uniref:Multidrug transporter n=1 Tax=Amycolatopsis antarctica TaxID=1854586 RepID=A0A263DA40_9PSEU|nr:phosphodiester glycosidase family protein [Amycolatopsis antarctica]OZM74245.1 hypothetical protein CFN78_03605 [Amycolatopsis antarctica]